MTSSWSLSHAGYSIFNTVRSQDIAFTVATGLLYSPLHREMPDSCDHRRAGSQRHGSTTHGELLSDMATPEHSVAPQPTLLGLPPELREIIFELALTEQDTIDIAARKGPSTWHPPPLLQTNRQLRTEALSIYFSRNSFALAARNRSDKGQMLCYRDERTMLCGWWLKKWLATLDRQATDALREVYVHDLCHSSAGAAMEAQDYYRWIAQSLGRPVAENVLHVKMGQGGSIGWFSGK